MGIIVGLPRTGGKETDFKWGVNLVETRTSFFPAEWYDQSGVQLTWPHATTDWKRMLTEVQECFVKIAKCIAKRERVLIVVPQMADAKKQLLAAKVNMENIKFVECATNDTWARDHGALSIITESNTQLLDFTFNGWGLKYAADLDNQITRHIFDSGILHARYVNKLDFVLEGGSIDSDGKGSILTTENCLLSPNRNDEMNKLEIEEYLLRSLHLRRVLRLHIN